MIELYEQFCNELKKKNTSQNTYTSYCRDVKSFIVFLQSKGISSLKTIDNEIINKYIIKLKKAGKSQATISRNLSSLRSFFKFLLSKKVIEFNPMVGIKNEKKIKSDLPVILSAKDIDVLLNSPDCNTGKGKRDKAMLEVMYATGIRVSELLSLTVSDVNLDIGCIFINKSTVKERVLPLYDIAINALDAYMKEERPNLVQDESDDTLFLNSYGCEMTRQGFWKIIKQYAVHTGIDIDITPKVLRHSFATHLLENGADIHIIKDMLGHSAISSTMVYTKLLKKKYMSVYENCHPRAKHINV